MKTNEFISILRAAPSNQLIFADLDGRAVHSGYHLTELKAAQFETVDCGGQTNRWQETIMQLWVPSQAGNEYMTAAKFLKIFDKVRGMIPVDLVCRLLLEKKKTVHIDSDCLGIGVARLPSYEEYAGLVCR